MSNQPHWQFRKMSASEINTNPVEQEFFTAEGHPDGILREGGQNSLDNRYGTEPVRLRFVVSRNEWAVKSDIDTRGALRHFGVCGIWTMW